MLANGRRARAPPFIQRPRVQYSHTPLAHPRGRLFLPLVNLTAHSRHSSAESFDSLPSKPGSPPCLASVTLQARPKASTQLRARQASGDRHVHLDLLLPEYGHGSSTRLHLGHAAAWAGGPAHFGVVASLRVQLAPTRNFIPPSSSFFITVSAYFISVVGVRGQNVIRGCADALGWRSHMDEESTQFRAVGRR